MDKFENYIKESLENYEAEYNPADWNNLEKKLNAKDKIAKITKTAIYSAATIAAAGLILYFSGTEERSQKSEVGTAKTNTIENIISGEKILEEKTEISEVKTVEERQIIENYQDKQTEKQTTSVTIPQKKEEEISVQQKEIPANKRVSEPVFAKENPEMRNYPAPNAAFHPDKNLICANSSIQFSAENINPAMEYRWNFGDGKNSAEPNPKHIYKNPGIYTVQLQVISPDKKSDIQTDAITVNPTPVADFTWRFSSNENPTLYFESVQEDVSDWNWDFGDRQFSSEQKPSHVYAKRGNYMVSLRMKNSYDCSATVNKNVNVVNDFNLLAPNAFSPNGDGKNDTWLPIALLEDDYVFTLTILDKAGNLAYKTSSKNQPWDGRHFKANAMVKAGDTFKWMAVVKDKNGTESTYGGVITIAESSGY